MLPEISTKTSSLSTSNKFLKSLLFFCDLFIFALIHPLSQAPVLIAVEKFSIDTGKERCPLCYVHFGNSGSFLGRTECGAAQGRGDWERRVAATFFFNLQSSIFMGENKNFRWHKVSS